MKKNLWIVSMGFVLSSCAVEMVRKTYVPTKGGTVRYSTGWFMAENNRTKAMTEMNQYCAPGRSQILSEDSREEFTGQTYSNSRVRNKSISTTSTQGKEGAMSLHFRCVNP